MRVGSKKGKEVEGRVGRGVRRVRRWRVRRWRAG